MRDHALICLCFRRARTPRYVITGALLQMRYFPVHVYFIKVAATATYFSFTILGMDQFRPHSAIAPASSNCRRAIPSRTFAVMPAAGSAGSFVHKGRRGRVALLRFAFIAGRASCAAYTALV